MNSNTNKNSEMTKFKLPPKDFNPLTASDKELLLYGFVRKPDANTDAHNYKLWEHIFSKKPEVIPVIYKDKKVIDVSLINTLKDGDNFAGVQINGDYNFNYILSRWIVPHIAFPGFSGSLPNIPEHSLEIFIELGQLLSNKMMLPITFGTEQYIYRDGFGKDQTTLQVFHSIPQGAFPNKQFFDTDIKPGDDITCLICINNNTISSAGAVSFSLINNTTNKYFRTEPQAFHPISLICARWGLRNFDNVNLAQYASTVKIKSVQCGGVDSNGKYHTLYGNAGHISNYTDQNTNYDTSTASITGQASVSIDFTNMLEAS